MAWQMALRYDTASLQLLEVRWPGEKTGIQVRDWHEPQKGELRVLWFDGEGKAPEHLAGTPLFYPVFRLKTALDEGSEKAGNLLRLGESLPNEAYTGAGEASTFELSASEQKLPAYRAPMLAQSPQPTYRMELYPNPASAHFRLDIWAPVATEGLLSVTDLLGRSFFKRSIALPAGLSSFNDVSLSLQLTKGQYAVSLDTPDGRQVKRLVVLK